MRKTLIIIASSCMKYVSVLIVRQPIDQGFWFIRCLVKPYVREFSYDFEWKIH